MKPKPLWQKRLVLLILVTLAVFLFFKLQIPVAIIEWLFPLDM
jgi:hypothetical protein